MEPSMFVGQIHKAVFENIAIDNDTIYNVPVSLLFLYEENVFDNNNLGQKDAC